jgi:hypothetical protein
MVFKNTKGRTGPTSLKVLQDPRFGQMLRAIDDDIAEAARAEGCPKDGGRLHSARYPRQVWHPCQGQATEDWRRSFCCAIHGCRDRLTPASVRFLGPRRYLGVVVVLVSAMCQGLTPRRVRVLGEELGIDRKTLERWCRWWQEVFLESPCWRELKGRLRRPIDTSRLPASLIECYSPDLDGLLALLRSLGPLTSPSAGRAAVM